MKPFVAADWCSAPSAARGSGAGTGGGGASRAGSMSNCGMVRIANALCLRDVLITNL